MRSALTGAAKVARRDQYYAKLREHQPEIFQ